MEAVFKVSRIPQVGDQSSDVEIFQQALNAKGASLDVDGEYGRLTRRACAAFQITQHLTGTGVAGEKTLKALGIIVSKENTPPVNVTPPKVGEITRDMIADAALFVIEKDINDLLRETDGKNRSKRIDSFNTRAHTYLGAPYCASGGWCAWDDACKKLGLHNPLKPTASSQDFRRTTYIPAKYIRQMDELGKRGDTATLQVVGDSSHGHHTTVSANQMNGTRFFDTFEYNTNGLGSRDGDGAYRQRRSTVDRSKENNGKIFVCFTDVPSYILEYNLGLVH